MDTLQKLRVLGQHMALEPAEEAEAVSRPTGVVEAHQVAACGQTPAALQQKIALGIQSAVLPGGKRLPLLKTLLTSACERDCYYCPFRAGRNFRRVTFPSWNACHAAKTSLTIRSPRRPTKTLGPPLSTTF